MDVCNHVFEARPCGVQQSARVQATTLRAFVTAAVVISSYYCLSVDTAERAIESGAFGLFDPYIAARGDTVLFFRGIFRTGDFCHA